MSLMQVTEECKITNISDSLANTHAFEIKESNMNARNNLEKRPLFDNKSSDNLTHVTMDAQVREWFTKLSSEERSGATCFSDRAFLGTFLALATPWSTATTTTTTTPDDGTNRDTPNVHTATPWDAMVSVNDFQREYQQIERILNDTPKQTNRKSSIPSDGNTEGLNVKVVDNNRAGNDEDGSDAESDDFRIRRLQDYEISFVRSLNEHPTKSLVSLTPSQQLLEEVAIIFPSSFQNISGSVEPSPHMIIRPSYFDNLTDEERFLMFSTRATHDNLPLTLFSDDMTLHSTSFGWLRRITSKDDTSGNPTVPLSGLLLARFEWAAWESFLEFECRKSSITRSEIASAAPDHHPKNHLLSVLGDILSHCRVINDRSLTIDSTTLEHFVAPLVKICFTNYPGIDPVKVDDVQNVVLTPVSWVWFASQRNHYTNFDVLDKAVETSLDRMDNDKEMSGISPIMNSIASGSGDPISPRKKKKKNRKKKNKKTVSVDNQCGTTDITASDIRTEDAVDNSGEGGNQTEKSDDAHDGIEKDNTAESIDADSVDSDDTLDVLLPALVAKTNNEKNEGMLIARQDGRMIIAAPLVSDVSIVPDSGNNDMSGNESTSNSVASESMEWDSWATVEVRGRNSRKKTPPPPPPPSSVKQSITSISPAAVTNESQKNNLIKKSKGVKTNGSQRKKGVAQKIVGDLLTALIDSIDDEAKRMKQRRVAAPHRPVNSWKNGPPGVVIQKVTTAATVAPLVEVSTTTLRDVLIGKRTGIFASINAIVSTESVKVEDSKSPSKADEKGVANKSVIRTDQNTAPTYQDTSSSSSNVILGSKEEPQNTIDQKCDTSSSDTEEIPQIERREISSKIDAINTQTPPLPTLLSPANANSANSSVASSLEAPPRGRVHHHADTVKDVSDVGYHLLDVCDRLSRDMSLFMSRRALALSARRRERGAVLSALQSSVASIWPGMCHVELYGSCATQLDLPSSDIDVVVLGLHRKSYVATQICSDNRSSSFGSVTDDKYVKDDIHHQIPQLIPSASYGMHRNAEQVVKLAADLEKQPWAVQVNAIPTASVPVIKVLADPSKVGVTSSGSDWMTQRQQMAGHAASAAGGIGSFENRPNPEYSKADAGSYPPPTHVPWRGSDVMKGLLSLDITFEGPEHGGIGSTEFSSRTVAELCDESGLHPDATPFVQTLMVLKELLAQRKLNEPYSGGLSSYALLLLVLALVKERAVIREEIELVEQQRRAMTIGELNAFPNGSTPEYVPDSYLLMQPNLPESNDTNYTEANKQTSESSNLKYEPSDHYSVDNSRSTPKPYPILKPSSWAMVAKMNPGPNLLAVMAKTKVDSPVEKDKQSAGEKIKGYETIVESSIKKQSFVDAVAGSKSSVKVTKAISHETTKPTNEAKSNVNPKENATHDAPHESRNVRSETATTVCHSGPQLVSNATANISPIDPKTRAPAFYPQGYNDIVEVLCSGETTAGKLLMHFLLYYGQHFDAQSTAIDISGKHERNFDGQTAPNSYLTQYIQRQSLGNIDPITGMLTVDPIIIYDPLEGSENNNVSRRCFAWNSVRWIFAQSYATLASAVERSATPPTSPNGGSAPQAVPRDSESETFLFSPDSNCDLMDPSSPLLRCLLSF